MTTENLKILPDGCNELARWEIHPFIFIAAVFRKDYKSPVQIGVFIFNKEGSLPLGHRGIGKIEGSGLTINNN